MSGYTKDEINFHKFLNVARQLHEVTLEQACEGLCSISMMKRIENGERLPEKQMRDRILSRMGVPLEEYEDYLSAEEFKQWELRQKLLRSIENKQVSDAEEYLKAYRIYEKQNTVEAQYCDAMELMILQMKNAPRKMQQTIVEHAVELTMPKIENGLSKKLLLSEQELNLLTEFLWLREYNGKSEDEFEWRCKQYKEIMNYIEQSHLNNFCRAMVYPKVAYYLSELILHKVKTEENLEMGIRICNEAIELLRDSSKLYYFIELIDALERLVKEYEIFLQRTGRQEEIEEFLTNLYEKKRWRDVIMELYVKQDLTPYMQNFCYLYWRMESHCIGDVIRQRRQMFGLTKEELCDGICSVKTLTRIEQKKSKTQMTIIRALFERLGLCAEYIRAKVITSDYRVLELAANFSDYLNGKKIKESDSCLKELEQALCMDIPQNRQFVMTSYLLLSYHQKQISKEEFVKQMIEIIEYTVPLERIVRKERILLSRDEATMVYHIGMRIEDQDNVYMETLRTICEQYEADIEICSHMRRYEFLMSGLISYDGNRGNYEESNNLSNRLLKKSLRCRRSHVLANTLYNNLWNNQQKGLCKREDIIYQETIKKCIILSEITKNDMLLKFYKQYLLNCNN